MAKASSQGLTGRQKAAILLITLGPEVSAQIFKHLRDEEIEQLTLEIANVRKVDSSEKDMIMAEFHQICLAQEYISQGGINYAREILEKALGSSKALEVINRLTATLQVRPFDFARKADPNQILNFIQNESPQTIALVLSYLQFEQAAAILSSLPQEKQADVARRVAVMDSTSPEVISQVERVLEQKLSSTVTQDYTNAGGIESIVQILNGVDRGTERTILDSLEIQDPELAEEIKNACLYSKISSMWMIVRFSALFGISTTQICNSHSKWQAKKFGMPCSGICRNGCPKHSKKRWNSWDLCDCVMLRKLRHVS